MSGAFLLTLVLGFGIAAAGPCSVAVAADQANAGRFVTGSMYNGNNAQPPQSVAQDRAQANEQTGKPEQAHAEGGG
jgi:hypothetical protein